MAKMKYESKKRIVIPLENGSKIILIDMRDQLDFPPTDYRDKANDVPDEDVVRNVYRVDERNAVVWQISGDLPDSDRKKSCNDMYLNENGQLIVEMYGYKRLKVDMESGYATGIPSTLRREDFV